MVPEQEEVGLRTSGTAVANGHDSVRHLDSTPVQGSGFHGIETSHSRRSAKG